MQFFLELKEKLKYFYSRYDRLLIAVCKFVFMFVLLTVIEKRTGYMTLIDKPVLLHLALALVCSVAPSGLLSVVGCGYLVAQLWYTSKEAAIVLGMMYFLVFCLFFVFHPGNSHLMLMTLLFSFWKMPAAIWVCAGMITNPFATIPVVFGLVIHDYLEFVQNNLSTLTSAKTVLTMPERLIFLVNGVLGNSGRWILFFVAFLTIGISFVVRKIPIRYSWIVGAVTSAVCSMLFTILGGYLFEIHVDVLGCVLGSILGLAFLMIYYFLVYSLNYDRMELVQFEDEDYVYYVKAIPKTSLPRQQISVKTFTKKGKTVKDPSDEHLPREGTADQPVRTEVVGSPKKNDTGILPDPSGEFSREAGTETDEFATKPIEMVRKEVRSSSDTGATAPLPRKDREESTEDGSAHTQWTSDEADAYETEAEDPDMTDADTEDSELMDSDAEDFKPMDSDAEDTKETETSEAQFEDAEANDLQEKGSEENDPEECQTEEKDSKGSKDQDQP